MAITEYFLHSVCSDNLTSNFLNSYKARAKQGPSLFGFSVHQGISTLTNAQDFAEPDLFRINGYTKYPLKSGSRTEESSTIATCLCTNLILTLFIVS